MNSSLKRFLLIIVIILSSIFAFSVAFTQFRGESEMQNLNSVNDLLNSLKSFNIVDFFKILISQYHPPARYIISLPFVCIFGPLEFSLRLANILFWIGVSIIAFFIGEKLLDTWCGFFSGLLIGTAGLFGIEAIGSTHGYLTFWIMLLILHILKNPSFSLKTKNDRKNFFIGNLFLSIGFLGFTSIIPIIFTYNLIYFYYAVKERPITVKHFILYLIPFIIFYITYYFIFLGIPYYFYKNNLLDNYVGQLYQNIYRKSSSQLNIHSFISNLKGINGYFFPFLSWLILVIGSIYLFKTNKHIYLMIIGYAILFSFYIYGNTSNHFLSYFIWIIPMSTAFIITYIKKYSIILLSILMVLVISWSIIIHVIRYKEKTYPHFLLTYTYSETFRINNIVRPVRQIADDLKKYLDKDEYYLCLTDGAIIFYAKDINYKDNSEIFLTENKCYKFYDNKSTKYIRAAVINEDDFFCDDLIEKQINYEKSYLKLIIFKNIKNQ